MKAAADAFAARVLSTIRDIQRHGAPSLRAIAETLNARGIPTARGGTWSAMQVHNVFARGAQTNDRSCGPSLSASIRPIATELYARRLPFAPQPG